MTANDTNTRRPSAEEILAAAPPVRHEPAARERIRAAHAAAGRRIAVLDDDPTGSQTVHDVAIVTVFEADEYAAGLAAPGSTCFILTNTRSLPEDTAVEMNTAISASLFALGQSLGGPMEVVSRSDSTLRGHVVAEIAAIDAARRRVTGAGFDGVLLVPCFFEAGRFTAGDIHWAKVSGRPIPAGETEFAQDSTFGYTSSNLRDFIVEKSRGTIALDEVHSISLDDIRLGGPTRVAEILDGVTGGAFVVVNATDYADLEIVVLGLLEVQDAGQGVRIPLRSVVPPSAGRARTSRPAHRGADLAVRPSGRPGARCRRFACRPDQPAGRQGAGTRRARRNRTARAHPA